MTWLTQDWTQGQLSALVERLGGNEIARAILADKVEIKVVQKNETEPTSIVCVDRSIRPTYCDWTKKLLHLELEGTGPSEFDSSKLEHWLHDGQKDGKCVKGKRIYEHLKANDLLKDCLGLRDLEEIEKKGITFFRALFKGEAFFAWKSVVRDHNGYLLVPYLCEYGGKVVLLWYWLVLIWHPDYPALRFVGSQ